MRFGVLAACLALPSAIGEQSYKYGGVDATGERLGVMPTDTGVDFSEPNEGYCDGCLSTLEAFHMQWLQYVSKESNEGDDVDQKAAGSSPPAITYNDEVEDTVNDICKSKSYREYGLSDQTTEVCQSMIGTEAVKRKIVAQFLAKDLGAKNLPVRKREACGVGGLVEACQPDEEARAFDVGGTSKCELCTAVVQDALYEARRHKHKSGPWKPQSIFDALDNLCPWGVLRHGEERVDAVYEVCDEMMDEHGKGLVDSIIKHYGDAQEVINDVCVGMTEACAEGADSESGDGGKKKKKKKKKDKKKKKKGKKEL